MGNNNIDNSRNQNNLHAIIKYGTDSNDVVTIVVDFTNGVLVDVLAYFFGIPLSRSNLPLGVTAAGSG